MGNGGALMGIGGCQWLVEHWWGLVGVGRVLVGVGGH